MEQLEIHHKSYLVRWVDVQAEHTISWSVQPHKKSINFGVFKHPGAGLAPTPRVDSSTFEATTAPGVKYGDGRSADAHDGPSPAMEKLKSVGMKLVLWHGNCEANLVTTGTYDVGRDGAGMYALVFDNTFAKSLAKHVTFVLLTYPTHASHQVRHASSAGMASAGASSHASARNKKMHSRPGHHQRTSDDSLPTRGSVSSPGESTLAATLNGSRTATESSRSSKLFTGILQKRRRKRHQGYARRFFSLDYSTNTLSYYHDRRTVVIRGAVPLSLAAVGTNPASREISIDSGAEIWHLKALNTKDFENWRRALEQASQSSSLEASAGPKSSMRQSQVFIPRDMDEERDWQRVEELVSRVSVTRDIARRLARDMDPKYLPLTNFSGVSSGNLSGYASSSDPGSPIEQGAGEDYFGSQDRRPFWKRKASGQKSILSTSRKTSAAGAVPIPGAANPPDARQPSLPGLQKLIAEEGLHEQSLEMLRMLDRVITDFTKLMAESKQRRMAIPTMADSRASLDSVGSDEFFDAEMGESQLLVIQNDSDTEASPEQESVTDEAGDASSASDIDDGDGAERSSVLEDELATLYPTPTRAFDLSGVEPVTRRTSIPPPAQPPPSLIGFLRKNVGKDLSTVAMPVSANEPISLLQKMEETLEYSQLLDAASEPALSAAERLLHVAAFAVSSLSAGRVKERAVRKPFNPLLGETYESVREDRGYRFVAEKISHRPVQLAWHAEASRWTVAQAPLPTQKFWGKSAELCLDGRVRLAFPGTGDRYAWTVPNCMLRNLLAGEKYVEPVGTMTVHDERNGLLAHVEFARAKGLFAGRSEGVAIRLYASADGPAPLPQGLVGKWTTALHRCNVPSTAVVATSFFAGDAPLAGPTPGAPPFWQTGALVSDALHCYGFTAFAATLNELLPRDSARLPPSDSRRRPDQRAAEDGDLPAAESLKVQLENAQRERRRVAEQAGEAETPVWFAPVTVGDSDDAWRLRTGKDGYWECRARGDWTAARSVFEL